MPQMKQTTRSGLMMFVLILVEFAFGQTGKPLSVCQILSELENYQGKTVLVRGYFEWGRHGYYLEDNVDERPCPMLEKTRYTSSPTLYMQSLASQSARIQAKLRPSQEIVNKEVKRGKNDLQVIATLKGELHYNPNATITRDQEGNYSGNGYGLNGACRAVLVIEEVLEAKVVKESPTNH
jgi:hypothetical protein